MLNNKYYGPNSQKLLTIYKTLIRSKLDYGSIVYASASDRLLQALEPVQNASLHLALGAFPTTPTRSLQALTGIPPLSYRRKVLKINYTINCITKLHLDPKIPIFHDLTTHTSQNLNTKARNILQFLPPELPPWKPSPIEVIWNLSHFKGKPSKNIIEEVDKIIEKHSAWICCFVDGSKSLTGTGGAHLIDTELNSYSLPEVSSPNTAEQLAIYQCLLSLPTDTYSKFLIFSDSEASLKKLQLHQTQLEDTLISHILYSVLQIQNSGNQIKFVWIPSHQKIIGHDIADASAKSASGPSLGLINPTDLRVHLRHLLQNKWEIEWQQQINKLRQIKPDVRNWSEIIGNACQKSRHLETCINRIYFGHSVITHQHLYLRQPPPICNVCNQTQLTIQHLIEECPSYNTQRRILAPKFPENISIKNIHKLIEFVKSTKLMSKL